jgi:hypothetical protein
MTRGARGKMNAITSTETRQITVGNPGFLIHDVRGVYYCADHEALFAQAMFGARELWDNYLRRTARLRRRKRARLVKRLARRADVAKQAAAVSKQKRAHKPRYR